jgi:subtilisin family serine protease
MKMRTLIRPFLLALSLCVAVLAGQPHAQVPGTPASVRFLENQVLIQFQPAATDQDRVDARGWVNAQRRELVRRGPDGDLELATLAPGIPVEFAVDLLSRHPAVRFAEPNWIYTHQATSNDPYYTNGSLWGMYGDATSPANQYGSQAGEAWAVGDVGSSSTVVGVIDTGIDISHQDLAANIWTNPDEAAGESGVDDDANGYVDDIHGWDFYQNNNSLYDGNSDSHGTHVAGTIGAKGGDGRGVAGVNWNVTIIGAKFLGPNGGSTANAVRAIDYITDLKIRHGLNIVATNNSWGGGGYSQALLGAITRGAKAGILFVAAAGNSGVNNDTTASYPSNYNTTVGTGAESGAGYDAVIAVAALTSSGAKASYSSYGANTVDLGAPGSSINSTLPGNKYGSYSGTSMATPHVTGAAALYSSMHATAAAADIKAAILASASNTPTASMDNRTVTEGRLNVGWFVSATPVTPPAAPSDLTAAAQPDSTSQVNLTWKDNSTDEEGFAIERCSSTNCSNFEAIATVPADTTSYQNVGLSASTLYRYRVRAHKGVGVYSGYSNTADATTGDVTTPPPDDDPPGITLAASGYKVKGVQWASLGWSGVSPDKLVDVYRNTVNVLTNTTNDGAHEDNIGKKGGGSYTYKVCEAGSTTACSNEATVTF